MPGHGRGGHAGEGAADAMQREVRGDGGGGRVAARPLQPDEPVWVAFIQRRQLVVQGVFPELGEVSTSRIRETTTGDSGK